MITKALLILTLAFVALGALRFAARPPRPRWVEAAIAGVVVAVGLLALKLGPAAALGGALAAWAVYRWRTPGPARPSDQEHARALLGVGEAADETEIREAHRRKIMAAHPDRGGNAETAAKLNAARDLLLRARRDAGGGRNR